MRADDTSAPISHDDDSLLDGVGTARHYADRAAELGQWALGQTNHGTLSGSLKHIDACNNAGIMPIVGVEAYFRDDRTIRKDKEVLAACFHLVLMAKNLTGWHNLMRVTSLAYSEGFYGRPALDWELLSRYSEGLIATSSCVAGYAADAVLKGDDRRLLRFTQRMFKLFGDDFYFEIMPHDFDNQRTVNVEISRFAGMNGIPLIAGQDAHVPYEDWVDTHEVMWLISTASSFGDREKAAKKKAEKGEDAYELGGSSRHTLYLTSEAEMAGHFARGHPQMAPAVWQEAMENTELLAAKVQPFLIDSSLKIPRVGLKQGIAAGVDSGNITNDITSSEKRAEWICKCWIQEGFDKISKRVDVTGYQERLDYELEIWRSKAVFGYFYVIGEGVRWARGLPGTMGTPATPPLRVGAGRGSACASLALYCMGVTGVDPIVHELLFERFMNPVRSDMPDVDVDFQHDRIAEVHQHYREVWGDGSVAQIVAHQQFKTKSALASVSRAFDVPYPEHLSVTKGLEDDGVSLKAARESSKEVAQFAEKWPEVWKHAVRVEGQLSRLTRHASGVVVLDRPIADYMPTMTNTPGGDLLTAWSAQQDFDAISKYGFLKLDFLSTDGLSIQARALELIEREHGERINLDELPVMWDPDAVEDEVLRMFATKRCFGVFQFGSKGVQQLLANITPTSFRDIVACNALYRPGPLEAGISDSYADRKNGREQPAMAHSALQPVLGKTHGLVVYQEQVVNVFRVLGGFSMAEADLVRKVVDKGIKRLGTSKAALREMEDLRDRFSSNAVSEHGLTLADAHQVWDSILSFVSYSFNIAHATGYAAQSVQDMWLKVHYPAEFFAAVMKFEPDKIGRAVSEASLQGVVVLPPDANAAGQHFDVVDGQIVFSLSAVKNVGDRAVECLVALRDAAGPYRSFEDFENRVVEAGQASHCNSRQRTSMLEAGAFDSVGGRDGWSDEDKRQKEKELLGFALNGVVGLLDLVRARSHSNTEFKRGEEGATFVVGGTITDVHEHESKRGKMGFVTLDFEGEATDVVSFSDTWPAAKTMLDEGEIILVSGRKSKNDKGESLIMKHVIKASELMPAP